jgi:hypothetical protein
LTTGWRFQLDPQNTGETLLWVSPTFVDEDWPKIDAGKRWEEQGFADADGAAWYRRTVDVPANWIDLPVWLVLGGVNDACTVYCNGKRVNSFGDESEHSVHATTLLAYLSPWLKAGEPNLIAVRCFDWGGSGGLWRLPCLLATSNASLPTDAVLSLEPDLSAKSLTVSIDLAPLGNERTADALRLTVYRTSGEEPLAEKQVSLGSGETDARLAFERIPATPGERYRVRLSFETAGASSPGMAAIETTLAWPDRPAWPAPYASLKVLNNFVTELLSWKLDAKTNQTFSFSNPRRGWIFISMQTEPGVPNPAATLDDEADPLIWRVNPDTGACEVMRLLPEGKHMLRVESASPATLAIRAVPELAYCYYPCSPHIGAYGPYDWAYMARYILPHVNTIVTRKPVEPSEFEAWTREGRQWISNASLPGLSSATAPAAAEVYAEWAQNPAVAQPGFSGIIVDEFLTASEAHYQSWGEAVRKLHENPGFSEKTFYAWCGDLHQETAAQDFCHQLLTDGDCFVWERYQPEESTADLAARHLAHELTRPFARWRKAMPGIEQRMVMCLGYLCAPPETVNTHPGADYHVFLDMQFRLLATDPTFFGMYGLMEYMSDYADEESMRFAHRLFRHYCIEGNTSPYVNDPYQLPHLKNPDFADGLKEWRIESAEPDSVRADKMKGFSWLQGRYPATSQGDRFCRMRRSGKAPNRITQTLRELQPGRLYSVKLISADLGQLDQQQTLGLSLHVEGAAALDEYGFQFAYPSCYSHEVGPYNASHPAWFNFHRLVFRAEKDTAELVIIDWKDAKTPGGPVGQELAFNFVEVQPFHAE